MTKPDSLGIVAVYTTFRKSMTLQEVANVYLFGRHLFRSN